MFIHSGRWVQP